MNIVRTPRLFKQSLLLLTLLTTSFILSACGGSDNKTPSVSSSSSSSSTHSLIPTSVTPTGSGIWPHVKVTANGSKALHFEWSSVPATTHYKLLKKADAASSFEQVGANITNPISSNLFGVSIPVSVHLTDWVNSRYKVQACGDLSCEDSNEIVTDSAMLSAIAYIKASNALANDWFGWSIALSGDGQTLAVGAPGERSNTAGVVNQGQSSSASDTSPNSGAVYIFTKTVAGTWQQQAFLKASNAEQPNDRFGYQIAISTDGNTLAVSATLEDSPSRDINCDQGDYIFTASSAAPKPMPYNVGAVYVFKRAAAEWAQTAYIKPHNSAEDLQFGNSLSLSGDGKTLAVGTLLESSHAAGVQDMRSASSRACIDFSASSVSSSSSSKTSNSVSSASLVGGEQSGAVYLFKETDAGWTEETFIKASDAETLDHFGISLSLSNDGNTLAVGAVGEDSKDSGATNDITPINGKNYSLNNGGVYIFTHANDAWAQQAKVKPHNNGINLQFGFSVALSGDGNTLAVGAPGDLSKGKGIEAIEAGEIGTIAANYDLASTTQTYASGAVYIFAKAAETWTATTYIKASNPQPSYEFGHSLALSMDGRILAVGSVDESSATIGINGDDEDMSAKSSGAAYLFQMSGNDWLQKSYIKAPNTATNDRFGNSLKLDDSGGSLVVGAHRKSSNAQVNEGDEGNDSSASATGAIYIY